jgi:DNA invertase Pin-like site-specific DNA recombinase
MLKTELEMIKGYARVSTDGQTLEAQHEALRAAGAVLVFAEKQSGVKGSSGQMYRFVRAWGHSPRDEA